MPTPAPCRRGKRRAPPKPRLYRPPGKDDEDLYAPRALRSDAGPLAVQLLALEVPECACKPAWVETPCRCEDDCDCPRGYSPPCRHVLDAAFNAVRLSLGGWAALVRAYDPEGYDDPAPAPVACAALARAEYLLALEERALARYGLWHPGDRRRKGRGACGVRGGPGRREGDGELVLDVPPPPKPPPDEGVLDAVARCARGRTPPPGWVLREKVKKVSRER